MFATILVLAMTGQYERNGYGIYVPPPLPRQNFYYAQGPVLQNGYSGQEGGWVLDLSPRPYRGYGWQPPAYQPFRHYDLAPNRYGGMRMRIW